MAAPMRQMQAAAIKREKAWMMHINGMTQFAIANELGITQPRVSNFIKQAAAAHPLNQLSLEERMAISEERWNLSEKEMRDAISEQRLNGRIVTKTTTDPYGKVTTEVTHQKGVDPALLRALSTHHDRRARQLNNQISPDASMQAVQVNVVKDFIQQGESQGRLSAEDWNQSQAVDV